MHYLKNINNIVKREQLRSSVIVDDSALTYLANQKYTYKIKQWSAIECEGKDNELFNAL